MDTPAPANRIETNEAHGRAQAAEDHHVDYMRIFLVLIGLTGITLIVSWVQFPNELINVLIALFIASVKAFCVARFFMHMKFEGKLIHSILYIPLGLAVVLALALIPDIGLGRTTEFHDAVGWFERMVHNAVGGE